MDRTRRRFGAILWEATADIDDAIRVVESFEDANAAVARVANECSSGETWAVVEIPSMRIVASSRPLR